MTLVCDTLALKIGNAKGKEIGIGEREEGCGKRLFTYFVCSHKTHAMVL